MKGTLANEDPVWHIGMIESVLEIDEAGLFVRWQTENGAWRIHVPTGVLPAGPKTGQVWRFLGGRCITLWVESYGKFSAESAPCPQVL